LAVAVGAAVSAWRVATYHQASGFMSAAVSLLGPGLIALASVYVFAWLGWALDID
jgi:hypothetical protein